MYICSANYASVDNWVAKKTSSMRVWKSSRIPVRKWYTHNLHLLIIESTSPSPFATGLKAQVLYKLSQLIGVLNKYKNFINYGIVFVSLNEWLQ